MTEIKLPLNKPKIKTMLRKFKESFEPQENFDSSVNAMFCGKVNYKWYNMPS